MCIVGVARELAAHFGLPLDVPDAHAPADPDVGSDITVRVDAPDRCPRYRRLGRAGGDGPVAVVDGARLVKAGMRPISNVVDVTNYVMLERSQPLHAFDLGRLAGRGIVVRLAERGEQITTLDGVERALTEEDLLICDAERRAAGHRRDHGRRHVGGLRRPRRRSCSSRRTSSAMGIARTSKRLGLRSEASARFERGIDPNDVAEHARTGDGALRRGGRGEGRGRARSTYTRNRSSAVRITRPHRASVNQLARHRAPTTTEIRDSLRRSASRWTEGDDIATIAPTFRPDLEREIDIVEEVARRVGLDADRVARCRRTPRRSAASPAAARAARGRRRARRRRTSTRSYTLPLVAPADLERAGAPPSGSIEVGESAARRGVGPARPRCCPGLLRAVAHNAAHGHPDVALFEVGHVFRAPARAGRCCPSEPTHLAARAGRARSAARRTRPIARSTVYDALDVLHEVFDALEIAAGGTRGRGAGPASIPPAPPRVVVDGQEIGVVGEVDAEACSTRSSSRRRSSRASSIVDALLDGRRRDRTFRPPVSRIPASTIDLAFVVDEDVAAGDVGRDACAAPAASCSRRFGCSTCSARTRSAPAR